MQHHLGLGVAANQFSLVAPAPRPALVSIVISIVAMGSL